MKDYLLTLKIQNNYLAKMMESRGIKNAAELHRLSGVSQSDIGKALNLKRPAYSSRGLNATASSLCDFFMCEVGDIYPPEHLHNPLDQHIFKAEYAYQDNLLEGEGACPSLLLESNDAQGAIEDMMGCLTERERKVIQMRHGMQDGIESTFVDIGDEFGFSTQWATTIYRRSLRKARHYAEKQSQTERLSLKQED
jgi:RNA polymerase primary sigma factor|tara:strand:- start:82 stop:666 length:585 start_codon:yes stop_codon:yes gene_type:complete